ncbi:MAG: hypothetical protein IJM57_02345 [Lachnospiraceae bacterium]|nr:hypothetical protein [Lachnospiraceae bacterium]
MRKHLIIMAVALLVTTVGSAVIIGVLKHRENTIVLTETTQEGSTSAAAGLTISFMEYPGIYNEKTADYSNISDKQWEQTIRYTTDGVSVTSRTMSDTDDLKNREKESEEKSNRHWESQNFGLGDYIDGYSLNGDRKYLSKFISQDIKNTLVTDGQPVKVSLSDILTYYPMIYRVSLPYSGDTQSSYIDVPSDDNHFVASGSEIRHSSFYENKDTDNNNNVSVDYTETAKAAKKLEEFFRIPVIREDAFEFSYDHEGDEFDDFWLSVERVGTDQFNPVFSSVIYNDAVYFTFDPHTEQGNVVDTSLIPGGYGIYILPFKLNHETGITTALTDELRLFVPLNPAMRNCEISISEEMGVMAINYTLDGQVGERIIDMKSCNCLYDEMLADDAEPGTYLAAYSVCGEDFVLVSVAKGLKYSDDSEFNFNENEKFLREHSKFFVIGKKSDGTYAKMLESNVEVGFGETMAFDGERLAVVHFSGIDYAVVRVYNKDGLMYKGSLETSFTKVVEYVPGMGAKTWDVQCRWE